MGYARYEVLVKGQKIVAGYDVTAQCDEIGCTRYIQRAIEQVCGEQPGDNESGCGQYFCDIHLMIVWREGAGMESWYLCPGCHEQWKAGQSR